MWRVAWCLTTQHDWRLVSLAGAVCILTCFVALTLFGRARTTSGGFKAFWLLATAAATGYGVWATHFIAMLAYATALPLSFDVELTLLSLLLAIAATGVGFAVTLQRGAWRATLGGALIGCGVAAMHYTGMWALEGPERIVWSTDLVVTSIILGVVFAAAAIVVAMRSTSTYAVLSATGLLALAVLAHHFVAMAGMELVPDPFHIAKSHTFDPQALALAIAAGAAAMLGGSLAGAMASSARDRILISSQAAIAAQAEQLEAALTNMSQGLRMFDADFRLVLSNAKFAEIYNIAPSRIVPGMTFREILEERVAAGSYYGDATTYPDLHSATYSAPSRSSDVVVELNNGRSIHIVQRSMPNGGWVATHEDVTERRATEARIAYMARHDALTGLPNRLLFREKLEEGLTRTQRGDQIAVHCLDLDRFKVVNDTLGHAIGDALLRAVTFRLVSCVREHDTVARLGGDEFAVVQNLHDTPAEAGSLATRIIEAVSQPYDLDSHRIEIGVSVGIALAPADGCDADQLLKSADLAAYAAKSDGRGTHRFFEPDMDARMQAKRTLELELRKALPAGEFELRFQPMLYLETGKVSVCEALLRWRHPHRGLVEPSDFVPALEEIGLIDAVGSWVLREACRHAASWPGHVRVAVNVSPIQFKSPILPLTVAGILGKTSLAPNRLELEITESVLLHDNATTLQTLHRLKDMGVRISMDDFGTGYSSLSYLRSFPFDKIKIDRSFVRDLLTDRDSLAIVRAVTSLGTSLGASTTAEGVETQDQLDCLREEGCTEVQGYHVGGPLPAHEVRTFLKSRGSEAA
jgi:diguanylate cyclase (GGDEF)-like protein